jgi:hypothetical protein
MIDVMRFFTLLAGLLVAAHAAVVPRIAAEELAAQSEQIVHGAVVRGPQAATITVSEPGGSLDGMNMRTSGTLPYTVGEDAVLFLYRTPIGYWRTVGGPQGKFMVSAQGRVYTDSHGMAFEGIPASDFLSRVRRLAAAHPYRGAR